MAWLLLLLLVMMRGTGFLKPEFAVLLCCSAISSCPTVLCCQQLRSPCCMAWLLLVPMMMRGLAF
jgi:hypothetical protein